MTAMAPFDAAYADRNAAARAAAGPVVGYLANTVPVEMIRAAGAFAQLVTGSPEDETADALRRMEPFFSGATLSIFQRYLDGRLGHLDAIVIPRSCEEHLQLYYHALAERGDGRPEPILFDILHTPFETTRAYNAGRLAALRDRLERVCGQRITDAALSASIAEADAVRARLAAVNALRTADAPRLSGAEMQRITLAAAVMAPSAFMAAADSLVRAAPGMPARRGVRLLLTGSALDTDTIHRAVEAAGATITADDHGFGDWWHLDPVGGGDPMRALLEKYHLNAPSVRTYPRARGDSRLMDAAARGRVQAAIFLTHQWDDTLGFDFPTQRALLAERDIPCLFLKEQPYSTPDPVAVRHAVSGFLSAHGLLEAAA